MKKVLIVLFIAITGLYASCKKEDKGTAEIYGKWKLTETLADPGDGSGRYTPVQGATKYITINKSGQIEGEALPEALTYKILDSTRLELTLKNNTKPVVFWYKVTRTTLEINPPCIEGCGLRFVRN